MRKSLFLALWCVWVSGVGCGGDDDNGSGFAPLGPNVQSVSVNSGILNDYANGIFTSVAVCIPGSADCQTIDNVLVDTGSNGLRLLSSASGGDLSLSLPQATDNDGNPIAECTRFADFSFLWGSVRQADVAIAGKRAESVPMNVIGDPAFPVVPDSCSTDGTNRSDLDGLAANGVLGVGSFVEDCGPGCAPGVLPSPPEGIYYTCPAEGCEPAYVSLAAQVQNPVARFGSENNGVILELPAVPAAGSRAITGALIIGIGTQANNGLGDATVFTVSRYTGYFTTIYNGGRYDTSFIDSGSNGIFFLGSAATGMPNCGSGADGFYCPDRAMNHTATMRGTNAVTGTVTFSIGNAVSLFRSGNFVFSNLGGPFPGSFDWGLPFFMGRRVFTAIEDRDTPAGLGPYWAY